MHTPTQTQHRPHKPTFDQLCSQLNLTVPTCEALLEQANIPITTFEAMLIGEPVYSIDAQNILIALSRHTNTTYTLDTVAVTLRNPDKPSFSEAFRTCPISYTSLHNLAVANVPTEHLQAIVAGKPVEREYAEVVLKILSFFTQIPWSFDTIDVPLIDQIPVEAVQDASPNTEKNAQS